MNWYALQVQTTRENSALDSLQRLSIETFLPTYKTYRRWSHRPAVVIERPLFPGYLFSRFETWNRRPIMLTPHVLRILGTQDGPIPIPDIEIETIQTMVASSLPLAPFPYLNAGERVLIERGPLTGLEGIVVRMRNSVRVVVTVEILRRAVAVEVDREWLRAAA